VREWRDLLAAPQGLAKGRRMEPSTSPPARRARQSGPDRLVASLPRLGQRCRQKGGEETGPNPVDRGRPGTKRHLVTDADGVPLAVALTGANVHDSKVLAELVDSIVPVRGKRGRPRKRPDKLHADKGYDFPRCRGFLRRRGIRPRIARRGVETSEKLECYRWVVERTLAWLARYRRLTIRYERRADIHEAFLLLACSLVCFNRLRRRF
jgi:transposase